MQQLAQLGLSGAQLGRVAGRPSVRGDGLARQPGRTLGGATGIGGTALTSRPLLPGRTTRT
ncbi:hypothetical protein GXW82_30905 [Streptacidiphilus sp. 4-A2]|nr:hypothetical protein [Streptacidiphilus sp. 4-A2]